MIYGYVRRFIFVLALLTMLSSMCMLPNPVCARISGDILLSSNASLRYNPSGYDAVHFEGSTRETIKLSVNFTVPLSDIPFNDTISLLLNTTEGHALIIGRLIALDPKEIERRPWTGDILLGGSNATWSHEYTVDLEGNWKIDLIGTIKESSDHDVAVIRVTPSKTVVGQGYSLNISVKVANLGNVTETFNTIVYHDKLAVPTPEQNGTFWSMGDVNRDCYIDDIDVNLITAACYSEPGDPNWNPDADLNQDLIVDMLDVGICGTNFGLDIWTYFGLSPPPIGKQTIALSSRNFTTITFTWNTSGFAKGNYTIWAYAWPVQNETDEEDNTLIDGTVLVSIVGDVNGDHLVDVSDLVITVGTIPSSPKVNPEKWNPNADINSDGICDVSDLVICIGSIPSSW